MLVAKLDLLSAILAKAAVHSTAVDLHQLMHSFTMDSYCAIAFGADAGCLTHEGEVPFAAAFDKAQQVSWMMQHHSYIEHAIFLLLRCFEQHTSGLHLVCCDSCSSVQGQSLLLWLARFCWHVVAMLLLLQAVLVFATNCILLHAM